MNSGKTDHVFLGLAAALLLSGLVMLISASGPVAFQKFGDAYWYARHQALYGLLPGVVVFLLMYRVDYRFWRRQAMPLLIVALALLALVFVPGVAAGWGTSKSWINIGIFSLQPAEVAKLAFLIYLAAWLESRKDQQGLRDLTTGLLPFILLLGLVSLLIILQPDIGSLSVIAGSAMVVYFVAGAPLPYLAAIAAGAASVLGILIKVAPYRAARLTTFLRPELNPQGIGYHINQAFLAIGSGGIFGLGLGHSRQKYLYLPEVVGDSIFAVMAEELGFILSVGFVILLVAFLWRGLAVAERAPDTFGRYLAAGIVAWIFVQSLLNIGSMVGVLPITGLPLPFVSYGGTAMVALLGAVGLMANISRQSGPVPVRRK